VYLCGTLGLIGFEHLAIDGQKIEADASFRRSKNLKQVKKEYAGVKQGLERMMRTEWSRRFKRPAGTMDRKRRNGVQGNFHAQ
jgi:hypothetical protein